MHREIFQFDSAAEQFFERSLDHSKNQVRRSVFRVFLALSVWQVRQRNLPSWATFSMISSYFVCSSLNSILLMRSDLKSHTCRFPIKETDGSVHMIKEFILRENGVCIFILFPNLDVSLADGRISQNVNNRQRDQTDKNFLCHLTITEKCH